MFAGNQKFMARTIEAGYGKRLLDGLPATTGRVFWVQGTSGVNYTDLTAWIKPDNDGIARMYTTVTLALAACTTGAGDQIVLAPDFTTALSAAELLSAETKGVTFVQAGTSANGIFTAYRATAALPATATGSLFTVTGTIKVLQIIGTVTTVIQTQACNLKLTATSSLGAPVAAVDLCANLDVTAGAVGQVFTITGTFATALTKSNSAVVAQAAPTIVQIGTIDAITSATNTGSVKWLIQYQPVSPGARVFAA